MNRLRFHKGNAFCIIIVVSILYTSNAFSQYVSPLESEGGIDTLIYKTDTVIFDATAVEDGSGSLNRGVFSTGLSMMHSPYISIFHLPVKYGISDNFQVLFSLPYITKTLVYSDTHYMKSGYGDTMFGFTAFFDAMGIFSSSTTARMTLPTGNVNAQDFGTYVPMGYGGYTASLQETISVGSFGAGPIEIRLFISGIGIYYFESTMQINTTEKDTFDKTYAWAAMGGAEIGLTKNLDIQVKGNYINYKERRFKTSVAPEVWVDADDEVTQVNIIPFLKYQFLDDISGQAGIIYPLKTTQDSDVTEQSEAKWKMVFRIEKRFGDEDTYKNQPIKRVESPEKIATKKPEYVEPLKKADSSDSFISTDKKEKKAAKTKKKIRKKNKRKKRQY